MKFEIRAFDFEAEEMKSVWYSGDYSLIDLEDILAEENLELDEMQTLQLYLDHEWLYHNIDEVLNNREIMNTPLKELLNDYKIYEMLQNQKMKTFNFEVREAFTPYPLNGEIEAKDKADAFNKIVEIYTHELSTSADELKIRIWEAE